MESLLLAFLTSSVLTGYAYFVSKQVEPGALRATLLLPASAAFFLLPVLLVDGRENPFLAQSLSCILAMSAFKIIALCGGRGCLSSQFLDAWTFFGICLLPVIPTSTPAHTGSNKRTAAVLRWVRAGVTKLACSVLLASTSLILLKISNQQLQSAEIATDAADTAIHSTTTNNNTDKNIIILNGTATGDDSKKMVPGVSADGAPPRQAALAALLTWAHPLAYFLAGVALMTEVWGMGNLVDAVALQLFGLVPEPHFDRPWAATSFLDFWARRWNLTVSSVLRYAFYEPIIEGRWVAAADGPDGPYNSPLASPPSSPPPSPGSVSVASIRPTETGSSSAVSGTPASDADRLRRRRRTSDDQTLAGTAATAAAATTAPAATIAIEAVQRTLRDGVSRAPVRKSVSRPRRLMASLVSFIASGLWHELLFYALVRRTSGGYWLVLFVLQPFILLIESKLKRVAAATSSLPIPMVAKLTTHGILLAQLALLWYPPMISSGLVAAFERQGFRTAAAATEAARAAISSARALLLLVRM